VNVPRTIRLDLAYDGTDFRGWASQRDPTIRTVESVLAAALAELLRESVSLSVAGRTDAGVHARGQVASFKTDSSRTPVQVRDFLNGRLAPEISIREVREVADAFDARFSASARAYHYVVDASETPDPFTGRFAWHRPGALDVAAMRKAAAVLVGSHDFTSFCRHPAAGRSTVRDLQRLAVRREGDRIVFGLRANAFLHQMVRIVVGTLVQVGQGRLSAADVRRMLAARDRSTAPKAAPALGLTLERVRYGRTSS
jgi:tRNA pseudouridine38-40 synthase